MPDSEYGEKSRETLTDADQKTSGPESRGNCDPHFPRRQRTEDPHRRRLFRRRSPQPASLQGGRGLSDRRGQGTCPGLSRRRWNRGAREGARRRRHPSGLRLSFGKSRAAARLRRGGNYLRWPERGPARLAGRQDGGAAAGAKSRPAGRAGHGRAGDAKGRCAKHRGQNRLSLDREGRVRRRRARHARGAKRATAAVGPAGSAGRSRSVVRQRRCFSGALYPPRAAHRSANPRRHPRKYSPSARARLLRAAQKSESRGSRSGGESRSENSHWARERRRGAGARVEVLQRGDRRISGRCGHGRMVISSK